MVNRMKKHGSLIKGIMCFLVVFSLCLIPALSARQGVHQTDLQQKYRLALQALKNKDYETAEQYLRDILTVDSCFREATGKSAWYQLGVVLERMDEGYSAIKTLEQGLDSLKKAGLNDWYLCYDLARLYAEHRIEASELKVTELVYQVLKNATPHGQPNLLQRIYYETEALLSEQERASFEQELQKPHGKPGFIVYRFFRRADINPITLQNESIVIFFQRTAEAKANYPYNSSPRGYDDRGEIYVRYGKPPKTYWNTSGVVGDVGYAIYPFEIWFYPNIHPNLFFTFICQPGHINYVLVTGPESVFGTFYRGRRTFFNRRNVGQTSTYLHLNLYQELAPLHDIFRERLSRLLEQYSNEEAADYARQRFEAEDRTLAARLARVTPHFVFFADDVHELMPLQLCMARFREKRGEARIEIYYSIPKDALFFINEGGGFQTSLRGEIGIFDEDFTLLVKDSLRHECIVAKSGETTSGIFISQWNTTLPPGSYSLYFRLENTTGRGLAVHRSDFRVPAFSDTALYLSDLELSPDIHRGDAPPSFQKHGLIVIPLVEATIHKSRPLYVYYEIYNLTVDKTGKTNYKIDYQIRRLKSKPNILSKMISLFGSKKKEQYTTVISTRKSGDSEFQIEHEKFDLSHYRRGQYQLKVMVTDLNDRERVSAEIAFTITE